MTREQVAEMIYWGYLVWVAGILNPFMILPQLYKIWSTRDIAGISLGFLFVLVFLQATFGLHGFFIRDQMVMWSNCLAAVTTAVVIMSVLYLRRESQLLHLG